MAKIKVEGMLATFEQIISSDSPVAQFKQFAKSLEDNMVSLYPSKKHMVDRNLGRFEASPSLKYRQAA
jgi:hypothetical protein